MAKKTVKKNTKKKGLEVNTKTELTKIEKQQNKQLIVFFIVMLTLLGGFLMTYFYFQQLNNFSYAGVDFQKGKAGIVEYYQGQVEMPRLSERDNKMIFNLYLRLDPRKNKIQINTDEFALSQQVVIAFEPESSSGKCLDSLMLAQGNMEQFFKAFPWVAIVSGAYTDKEYAEERGLAFASCDSARPDRTVVIFNKSDTNSIEKQGNCYILNMKECDYLEVSERLMIGFVAKINKAKI